MASVLASKAGQMALSKGMQGQQGKGPNPRHEQIRAQYGKGKDMSQYANMGGLLNMMNQMSQNQQRQPGRPVDQNEYIRSLLG